MKMGVWQVASSGYAQRGPVNGPKLPSKSGERDTAWFLRHKVAINVLMKISWKPDALTRGIPPPDTQGGAENTGARTEAKIGKRDTARNQCLSDMLSLGIS